MTDARSGRRSFPAPSRRDRARRRARHPRGDGRARARIAPAIIGTPFEGETSARRLRRRTEVASFPGDLPEDPAAMLARTLQGPDAQADDTDFRFLRFRPPLTEPGASGAPRCPTSASTVRCNSCSETASHDSQAHGVSPRRSARDRGGCAGRRENARATCGWSSSPSTSTCRPRSPRRCRRKRVSWGTSFWSALGGLVALGIGLATTRLIEDLYARANGSARSALALAAVALLALLSSAAGIFGLFRLASIEKLRSRAEPRLRATIATKRARSCARSRALSAAPRSRAAARARRASDRNHRRPRPAAHRRAHADGLARSGSRTAGRRTATRVSVVTAVSPRAAVDLAFVLIAALGMIRRLAALYGGRPGMLGLIRLVRHVVGHLALTGGIAAWRQPDPAGARSRRRGEALRPTGRGRAERAAYRPARPRGD
jgi:putative membrane protein